MTNQSQEHTPLTPEEQAQAPAELLAAIESGSVVAAAWLASWRNRRSIGEEARAQAEGIRQEVAAAPPEQSNLAQWCGFPTDMTRCSPFFPINVRDLGQREFLNDFTITSANWGEIHYTGPKLSTYEEDALMALLAIFDNASKYKQISKSEDRKTYTYKGPVLPLLRILYGDRTPSKKDYNHFINALNLMTVAGVKISISSGKTKSGRQRSPRITQMSSMLSCVYWDDQNKELTATINPYFYEIYMEGRVTLIDVTKRIRLKGVISKALYRFTQSHRKNPVFIGHFLTLADALNMDREQPAKEVRRKLKTAINELIRQGILMKKSGFVDTDIIKLERASESLPPQGKKNLENS